MLMGSSLIVVRRRRVGGGRQKDYGGQERVPRSNSKSAISGACQSARAAARTFQSAATPVVDVPFRLPETPLRASDIAADWRVRAPAAEVQKVRCARRKGGCARRRRGVIVFIGLN